MNLIIKPIISAFFLIALQVNLNSFAQQNEVSDDQNQELLVLKTGERLEFIYIGWTTFTFNEKSSLDGRIPSLEFKFKEVASGPLRQKSLQEIVTRRLLPYAIAMGQDRAVLLEKTAKVSIGPVAASSSEMSSFKRLDGHQWLQEIGTDLDWSTIVQELKPDTELPLQIPLKPLVTTYDSGVYNVEIHTVANEDVTPKQAMMSIAKLLVRMTKCEYPAAERPAFLFDKNFNGIIISAKPEQQRDQLHILPKVELPLGKQPPSWTCNEEEILEAIRAQNWLNRGDWSDIIPSIYKSKLNRNLEK